MDSKNCPVCQGRGYIPNPAPLLYNFRGNIPCPECNRESMTEQQRKIYPPPSNSVDVPIESLLSWAEGQSHRVSLLVSALEAATMEARRAVMCNLIAMLIGACDMLGKDRDAATDLVLTQCEAIVQSHKPSGDAH